MTFSEGDTSGKTILMSLSGPTSRPIRRLKAKQVPKGKIVSTVCKEIFYTTKQLKEFANPSTQKSDQAELIDTDPLRKIYF